MNDSVLSETKRHKRKKVIIEDVITKDLEKMEPCLVQFSNGILKDSEEVNVEGTLQRKVAEKNFKKAKDTILTVSSSHMQYKGKNFGDDVDSSKERFFLGILNKETNRMKLIETSTFVLHPETSISVSEEEKNLTFQEKLTNLETNFGGKRGRLLIKRRNESQSNIEGMSKAINEAFKEVKDDITIEDGDNLVSYEDILPPMTKDYSSVHEVYKLENIIKDEELILFNEDAMECLEGTKDTSECSSIFKESLAMAKMIESEEESAKLCCTALYLENLIIFQKTRFERKPKFFCCSKYIVNKILDTFTEGKRRLRTKKLDDKLMCYIIVLALICNKFSVKFSILSQSTTMRRDKLQNLFRIIGVTTKYGSDNVVLKLPLKRFRENALVDRKRIKRKL